MLVIFHPSLYIAMNSVRYEQNLRPTFLIVAYSPQLSLIIYIDAIEPGPCNSLLVIHVDQCMRQSTRNCSNYGVHDLFSLPSIKLVVDTDYIDDYTYKSFYLPPASTPLS